MNQQIIWEPVNHPDILPGYLISPEGYIKASGMKDEDAITSPSYHSTNGYDFMLLNNKDGNLQLFPLDDIIAMAYIPIPESFKDKPIKVSHINGDTRDISLDNLQWVEDIEEWRVCTYPGVKPDMYEVSSWGRVRNKRGSRLWSGSLDRKGYIRYHMFHSDESNFMAAGHRLIAWEFCNHDNDFMLKQVNHIDGVKINNCPKNLESVSQSKNIKHAFLTHLNTAIREDHPKAKLSNSEVELICKYIVKYKGDIIHIQTELAKIGIYVEKYDIGSIKNKANWKTISDKYFKDNEYNTKLKLTMDDAENICNLLLKYNGNRKKVLIEIRKISPYVRIGDIKNIKGKHTFVKISDKYFPKGYFKK